MSAAGMADVLPLPKARVPVVKFTVPKTGTKVGGTSPLGSLPRCRRLLWHVVLEGKAGRGRRLCGWLAPPPLGADAPPLYQHTNTRARAAGGHHREQRAGVREHQAAGGLLRLRRAPGPPGGPGQALGQAARGERPVPRHPLLVLLRPHVHTPAPDAAHPRAAGAAAAAPHLQPHRGAVALRLLR
jgi:hypothetical protein